MTSTTLVMYDHLAQFIIKIGKTAAIDITPEMNIVSDLRKMATRNDEWYHRLNILNYRVFLLCLSMSNSDLAGQWLTLIKDY